MVARYQHQHNIYVLVHLFMLRVKSYITILYKKILIVKTYSI